MKANDIAIDIVQLGALLRSIAYDIAKKDEAIHQQMRDLSWEFLRLCEEKQAVSETIMGATAHIMSIFLQMLQEQDILDTIVDTKPRDEAH